MTLKTMQPRMTTRQVAEIYGGVTIQTIRTWCRRSAMPHRRIGREFFFLPDELEAWDNAQRVPAFRAIDAIPRPRSRLRPVDAKLPQTQHEEAA